MEKGLYKNEIYSKVEKIQVFYFKEEKEYYMFKSGSKYLVKEGNLEWFFQWRDYWCFFFCI